MAKVEDMEKVAKKASAAFKTLGNYLLQVPVTSFPPIWLETKDVVKEVAAYPPMHIGWRPGGAAHYVNSPRSRWPNKKR